jgi:hypothetical protein
MEIKHEVTRVSIKLQVVLNHTSLCVLVKKVVSTNRGAAQERVGSRVHLVLSGPGHKFPR